jgi:bifunctional ADP-heptose synthase (sugar kinase/adenylyltransferase)
VVDGGADVNLAEMLMVKVKEDPRRIVVIGDAMVDQWVHGRIHPCQDDCPKFVDTEMYTTPGGAANALQSVHHWGVKTDLFSYGRDMYPIKRRFIDEDGRVLWRWDDELREVYPCNATRKLALQAVQYSGAVLISDYDKGFMTPEYIARVIEECREHGVPCVADAKREPDIYRGALLKCNREYFTKYRSGVVVTRGAEPPVGLVVNLPPVACRNHIGAGDCFAAHLALALAYEFSLPNAMCIAYSAGRVYVQHLHNRPPRPEEIAEDCST